MSVGRGRKRIPLRSRSEALQRRIKAQIDPPFTNGTLPRPPFAHTAASAIDLARILPANEPAAPERSARGAARVRPARCSAAACASHKAPRGARPSLQRRHGSTVQAVHPRRRVVLAHPAPPSRPRSRQLPRRRRPALHPVCGLYAVGGMSHLDEEGEGWFDVDLVLSGVIPIVFIRDDDAHPAFHQAPRFDTDPTRPSLPSTPLDHVHGSLCMLARHSSRRVSASHGTENFSRPQLH